MDGSERNTREAGESEAERNNRNLSDLLQELRVAGLGVQVLFGFLLSLPFSVRFKQADGVEQALYRVSVLCAALAIALLVSPVAYHRWVFRRHEKARLLRYANIQAILGLAMVAAAVCAAIWMVLLVVGLNWPTALLAGVTSGVFLALWFALPIVDRLGADRDLGDDPRQPSELNDAATLAGSPGAGRRSSAPDT
jgi:O-antigen/teichoic acid export membrane protein